MLRAALAAVLLAVPAAADVVTLKDGRVLEGQVLSDDGKTLKIQLRKGAMTLNRADVVSVVEKPTPEEEYAGKLAQLDAKSAAAQLELGRWAASKELEPEAISRFLEAWRLDAKLDGVAAELEAHDYHLVDGAWLDPDAYYPTIGWVKFDGRWISPAEHACRLLLKEAAERAADRDKAKAELAAAAGKLKKFDGRIAAEQSAVEKAAKALAKAEADAAAAEKRFNAAQDRVKTASDKLVAIQQKEKPKEGEAAPAPSPGAKEAEKKLAAAREAAEKESKSVTAAREAVNDAKAEQTAAKVRLEAVQKEKAEAEAGLGKLEEGVAKAQAAVDAANAKAAEAKAAWEKAKQDGR